MDDYHSFVKEMEKVGFKVRMEYYRYKSLFVVDPLNPGEIVYTKSTRLSRYFRRTKKGKQFTPYPKGGKSVLNVYDGDKLVAQGIGKCMLSDNFDYKEAKRYALDNLMLYGFTFQVKANAKIVINQKIDTVESGASFVGVKIGSIG